jgi:hypothetical protein
VLDLGTGGLGHSVQMAGSAIDALEGALEAGCNAQTSSEACCLPLEEDLAWIRARMKQLLSGGSTWYTASDVQLGFAECSMAVKRKTTADVKVRSPCCARGEEVAQGSTNFGTLPQRVHVQKRTETGREQQQSFRCRRLNECSRALHGRANAVPRAWRGARRASGRHKKAAGSRGPGRLVLPSGWIRDGESGGEEWLQKSRPVISKGLGWAN